MSVTDALENNPNVSKAALEALHADIGSWALSRCNFDPHAAEDLVQQAYVEILSGRARFDGHSSLRTFLFAVVQKLALSRFRRVATRLRLLRQFGAPIDAATPAAEPGDARRLWRAVEALPARQRDIIELVFLRELTIEEAARVMGVTTGTGRTHYERAKQALRRALGNDGDTHGQ